MKGSSPEEPFRILQVRRIWDNAAHNAFTDLVRFKGSFYCTFRESGSHMKGHGKIRVLESKDGERWQSVALFGERGVDLRDPKLSVTPDGRLLVLMGGTEFRKGTYVGRQPRVSLSGDGHEWSAVVKVLANGDWLWRLSWHEGTAYGVTYRLPSSRTWTVFLVSSADGTSYQEVCKLGVTGKPNEATVRVLPDGGMVALVRREGGDKLGWVGRSLPPYTDWTWKSCGVRLGGPNFIFLPDGRAIAATRIIRGSRDGSLSARTVIARMEEAGLSGQFELPSGGDCGYPGLVWHRRTLWVSYYSSHQGKSAIYIARIKLR